MFDRTPPTALLLASLAAISLPGCSSDSPDDGPLAGFESLDAADPGPRRAVAQYEVSYQPLRLLDETVGSEREFDTFRATQVAYVRSPFVLTTALRDPKVASAAILDEARDPIRWLQEHLIVGYPSDGEILEIAIAHPTADQADLVLLTNAICAAYHDEILFRQQSQQRLPLMLLKKAKSELGETLSKLRERLASLERDSGAGRSGELRERLAIERLRSLLAQRADICRLVLDEEARRPEVSAAAEADDQEDGDDGATSDVLTARLAKVDEQVTELTESLLVEATENPDLIGVRETIAQTEATYNKVASRVQELEIELVSPARVRAIGVNATGHALAEFVDGD